MNLDIRPGDLVIKRWPPHHDEDMFTPRILEIYLIVSCERASFLTSTTPPRVEFTHYYSGLASDGRMIYQAIINDEDEVIRCGEG